VTGVKRSASEERELGFMTKQNARNWNVSKRKYLNIGLDFDNTYSADPSLWDEFIAIAQKKGHRVICVTARRDTEENIEIVKIPGIPTIFTSLGSKIEKTNKLGLEIDIWIDDDPLTCARGH
jgi:hypothetical protein